MKTYFSFYRPLMLAILFVASLSACKKNNTDPAPDLASRVAGTYSYSELVAGGQTYPASKTDLKGTMNVTRQSATTVSIIVDFRIKSTNEVFLQDSADDVTVVDAGSGNIEYRLNGNVIAKGTTSKLSITGEDNSGAELTISATK